jgi:hypothetical protein
MNERRTRLQGICRFYSSFWNWAAPDLHKVQESLNWARIWRLITARSYRSERRSLITAFQSHESQSLPHESYPVLEHCHFPPSFGRTIWSSVPKFPSADNRSLLDVVFVHSGYHYRVRTEHRTDPVRFDQCENVIVYAFQDISFDSGAYKRPCCTVLCKKTEERWEISDQKR